MPIKRYGISITVVLLWVALKLSIAFKNLFNPNPMNELLSKDLGSGFFLVAHFFNLFYVLLAFYLVRRIYLVLLKRSDLIIKPLGGNLLLTQKLGAFTQNLAILIFAASFGIYAFIYITSNATGSFSGIPLAMGIMFGVFCCFISVILIETGNHKANKKLKHDAQSAPLS
jgi:hypothetical protein